MGARRLADDALDPDLIRQLEAAHAASTATQAPSQPVGATTAAFLEQMHSGTPNINGYMQNAGMPFFRDPSSADTPTPQMLSMTRGARDFLDTWAQRAARGVEAAAPMFGSSAAQWATDQRKATEAANQNAELDYRTNWRPDLQGQSDPFRTVGAMVPNAIFGSLIPGGAAASLAGRMGSGTASGGLYAGQPDYTPNQSGGDYWKGQALGAAPNAVVGGLAPAVMGALARIVRPNTSPEVQTLMENGVTPTPGQIMGGSINRLEQAGTSVPLAGDFIKSARARAGQQFDRAAIDQVLEPIGSKLEAPTIGRDAIEEMGKKVSDAYNAAVPNAAMALPATAQQDIATLRQMAQYMPPDRAKQFENFLQGTVLDKISPNGHMTGESFKEAESDLGKQAAGYLFNHASTSDERQLGAALREVQSTLRGWLQQANPQSATEIGQANQAYARMLRVENASARSGAEPGAFSPAQLQAAVKKFGGTRPYAQGNALMQPLADAGRSVLGATLPDSGTPFRSLATIGAGAALGHGLSPEAAMWAMAGTGLLAGTYNPLSQYLIAHALTSRPQGASAIADAIRRLSPTFAGSMPGALAPLSPY